MVGNLRTKKGKFVCKLLFVSTTSSTITSEQKPKHFINQYKKMIDGDKKLKLFIKSS